jgi:hypothetical protein
LIFYPHPNVTSSDTVVASLECRSLFVALGAAIHIALFECVVTNEWRLAARKTDSWADSLVCVRHTALGRWLTEEKSRLWETCSVALADDRRRIMQSASISRRHFVSCCNLVIKVGTRHNILLFTAIICSLPLFTLFHYLLCYLLYLFPLHIQTPFTVLY